MTTCFKLGKLVLTLSLSILFTSNALANEEDPHLWLEAVDDEKALSWVRKLNTQTQKNLGSDPLYAEIYKDALSALNNKDKLPEIEIIGDWVYYLKKSPEHPRGLYVRSSFTSFKRGNPKWQTVIDIDAKSAEDDIQWVFHGLSCLSPEYKQCVMRLSPGGGDADVMFEFDANTLQFVKDGFQLPQAKMFVGWVDADHLFVGTDFGPDSLTDSGYPRIAKLWRRGSDITDAETIFSVNKSSVSGYAMRLRSETGQIDLLVDTIDYWNREYHQWLDGEKYSLQLPSSAVIEDYIEDYLVVTLHEDWIVDGNEYNAGSVLLISPESLWEDSQKPAIKLLRKSRPDSIIEDVKVNKNNILVTVLQDVKSKVYSYQKLANEWLAEAVDLPKSGQLAVVASNPKSGEFFARYEGFLTPPTLYSVDTALNSRVVMQQSPTFNAKGMIVEQFFARSKDGTQVPYFVVMQKKTKFDGTNPTHIFSYGGFRASLTPSYSGSYEAHNGAYGKAWLERGGVFVLANIRGGAEYGPAWHSAALLENRYKAFEDFEAVAEDLIERKITSAKHLGIEGRSNGGLLVGATMIRRPDLYGAVICGVPLLDMQRYNKLLAGASWMAEYGNPDTSDWEFMKAYSPYQNVSEEATYPPIFFFTSTRDDRVHPGHARKMAAKMRAQGHSVDYYENTEGGHKGSATAEQTAQRIALSFTHLWRHLK